MTRMDEAGAVGKGWPGHSPLGHRQLASPGIQSRRLANARRERTSPGTPTGRRESAAPRKRPSTAGRISGYTNAVFAVIITIMVLELHAPSSARLGALLGLWPTGVSYLASYVFIAIIWINHHYLMGYVKVPSLRLIWLNFAHLFFVSLLPFATAWIARTELAHAPVIVYATLCVITDGAYNLFEDEVLRNSPEFSKTEYRANRRRSLIALALFAIAIPLAVVQPLAGFGFICLALVLHLRPDASGQRRRLRRYGTRPGRPPYAAASETRS